MRTKTSASILPPKGRFVYIDERVRGSQLQKWRDRDWPWRRTMKREGHESSRPVPRSEIPWLAASQTAC